MSISKKRLIRWGLGLGILLVVIVATPLILLSDQFEYWAKDNIIPLLKKYHPIGHLRTIAVNIKDRVNDHPVIVSENIGFQGNRAELTNGVLSWIAPFSDRIPPTDQPPTKRINTEGKARALSLVGLKGETLSFQLVMRSDKPIQNLSVSLIPDVSVPESSCITVHRFLEVYIELMTQSGNKLNPLVEITNPDPLIPFNDPYMPNHNIVSSISLKPKTNQPVWFDLHFSDQCSPGVYTGKLQIRSRHNILRNTTVSFTILSPTLPKRVNIDRWMETYSGRLSMGELLDQNHESFLKILPRYFIMAHQYGFATNRCTNPLPNVQWDWNTGKPTSINWDSYDQEMGPLLSGKLTGSPPNVWCLPIPTETLTAWWGGFTIHGSSPTPPEQWKGIPDIATQELARLITKHYQEKGWPINQAFAYPFDEPGHYLFYPDFYHVISMVNHSIHEGSNNKIKIMITEVPYAYGSKDAGKKYLKNEIDIWSPGAEVYVPDLIKKEGKKSWFYQGRPPFIGASNLTSTGIGFRMWFWTAWKYRVNGVFYWASDMYAGNTRSMNPFHRQGIGDGEVFYPGHQLHFLGYPDIDGPIPSIRMAQWRRGYEDYKYFVLLKEKGHGKEADQIVNSLVQKALDDGGYHPPWRNPLWGKPGEWNHDSRAWHQARLKMAKELSELYPAGK
ncbi:MAG: DUF4091 domain-containing protein [Leptospirillum sp.]